MRLWSLHPALLDRAGLVAAWREGLLAQKVLQGMTRGYRFHPQLNRFKSSDDPLGTIGEYLIALYEEAKQRGYSFDENKIQNRSTRRIAVNSGQLTYEFELLSFKAKKRSPQWSLPEKPIAHPLFYVVSGPCESWEKIPRKE